MNDPTNEPPIEARTEVQVLAEEVLELRLALHGFQDMLSMAELFAIEHA